MNVKRFYEHKIEPKQACGYKQEELNVGTNHRVKYRQIDREIVNACAREHEERNRISQQIQKWYSIYKFTPLTHTHTNWVNLWIVVNRESFAF